MKKDLPTHFIKIIWSMITNRNFSVYDAFGETSMKVEVKNGLQETVNSPFLFDIFNSNILKLFDLKKTPYKKANL